MRGFVETLAEHEVRGWAFDDAHPGQHLMVVAHLDGVEIGRDTADILRPDLLVAGIGDGDHEFRILFTRPLAPADLGRLEVRAERGSQSVPLGMLEGSNQSRADSASNPVIPIADPDQHPVFILGPARSGTSALALALLKSGRYKGHGEGHLMPLAQLLLRTVDEYYERRRDLTKNETTLRAIHLSAFQRMVRRGFVQLTREAFPTGYWIDKTPTAEMVRAAPLVQEIWPNARFVFLKRRVIENIQSRRRKFPKDTLQNHYLDWVDVLSAWQSVRDKLGTATLEIDQYDLARHSDQTGAKIARFLAMPPDAVKRMCEALSLDHPEQTSTEFDQAATLDSLGLSSEERRMLLLKCDPVMSAFGYSYDEDYFATEEV